MTHPIDDQPAIPDSYAQLVALLEDSNLGTVRTRPPSPRVRRADRQAIIRPPRPTSQPTR